MEELESWAKNYRFLVVFWKQVEDIEAIAFIKWIP
jgi:hypothetical protein